MFVNSNTPFVGSKITLGLDIYTNDALPGLVDLHTCMFYVYCVSSSKLHVQFLNGTEILSHSLVLFESAVQRQQFIITHIPNLAHLPHWSKYQIPCTVGRRQKC